MRFDGLRVVVYPNDHRPAHVHVLGGGREAVFDLHCPAGPLLLREIYGFSRRDAAMIAAVLAAEVVDLCAAWRRIHGQP